MKKKIKNIYYGLILGILLPLKMVFSASTGVVNQQSQQVSSGSSLQNPLGGIDSLESLVVALLKVFVAIGTPIAVLFLMYSGYQFIVARGNPTKIQDAQKALMWTIVGIVILLGAELLSEIVKGTIQDLGTGILIN
ncbi:pilin [Patescibacteria group bacterium]|nr:pilin [Patescibacteria group bacterium]MCG2694653.1 pilin [Candidatus Parcubacteria bacterium]